MRPLDRPFGPPSRPLVTQSVVVVLLSMIGVLGGARDVRSQPGKTPTADTRAGMIAYNAGQQDLAYTLLRRSAEAGDAEAMVNLGYFYARGQVVPMNQAEAFRLYAASAAKGNSEGMNALGYKYQHATGIPRDIGLAVTWYCRAVGLGNRRAMNNLATVLDLGEGVPRDLAGARGLWVQSARLGHRNAMYNLGLSYLQEPEPNRDAAAGTEWLIRAARAGHGGAHALLRRNAYTAPLPAPYDDDSTVMIPTQRGTAGHARICGVPLS